jgi:hypothetical protein
MLHGAADARGGGRGGARGGGRGGGRGDRGGGAGFGIAGTKDKRGVTAQWATLYRVHPSRLSALNSRQGPLCFRRSRFWISDV